MCCLRVICAADARPPPILATNYDQTCTVDSDCIAEGFGDPCIECLNCANAAINKKSEPQYRADKAMTPDSPICFCTFGPTGPCCVHGICQVGNQCFARVPPTDSGAEVQTDTGAEAATDAAADASTE